MLFRVLACLLALTATCASAQTGTIEGKVKLPPREAADSKNAVQYPGQPGMVQLPPTNPAPAVVFVKGSLEGRASAPPLKNATLSQKDAWFIPEVLAVLVGTTVDFPNLDPQYHNVFSYSKPKRFDLGRYPTGESRPVTFDKPGVVKIYCEIHEHMRAWVVVCENSCFAVTDPAGKYRIENVPAGKHTVVVWRPQGKELEKGVTITGGQLTAVDFE